MEEGICKLCLQKCGNLKAIGEDTKNILDTLLLKIDFAIIRAPVMCKNCAETLLKCFNFKAKCLHTHNYVVPFLDNKGCAKLDLKDVFQSKNVTGSGVLEDHDICTFCMDLVRNCSEFFYVEEGDITLKTMIEQYLPELDLNLIKKPVICAPCYASLENFFHFVTNCLNVQDKVKEYCETPDINVKGEIELKNLLQYTTLRDVKREVDDNSLDIIKVEKQLCEDRRNSDGDISKLEQTFFDVNEDANADVDSENDIFTEMDEQKVDIEHLDRSRNIWNCKEESDKLGLVKKEEIFCGENETKVKEENVVDIKDKFFFLNEEIEIKTDEQDFSRFEDGLDLPHSELTMNPERNLSELHKDPSKITMYRCDSCSFQTKHKFTFMRHSLMHKDPAEVTMYKCDSCPFQTKHKFNLKNHLRLHKSSSEITMYKCESCSYQTKNKYYVKEHLLMHKDPSEVTMYKCDFCSYQTKNKYYLKRHLLIHKDPSEITMYKCNFCSYQTKFKHGLKEHLPKHKDPSEVPLYKCDVCPYQTKRKNGFYEHLLKHKDPSELTLYKCDVCPYQTKRRNCLYEHLMKHKDPSEATIYRCDSCSFQTKHKGYLKDHLLKHKEASELPLYRCDSCPYQGKNKHYLKRHLLMHKDPSDVTTYKCDYCSFQTKRKHHLNRHVLNHKKPSEVAMYKCDCCLYQTKHTDNLRKHLALHKKSVRNNNIQM